MFNSSNFNFRHIFIVIPVFIAAMMLVGCGVSDPKSSRFVVAKGKGVEITRAELDRAINQFLNQNRMSMEQLPKEMKRAFEKQILEQMVTRTLLVKAGSDLKIPDLKQRIEDQIKKIKAQFPNEEAFQERLKKMGVSTEKVYQDIKDQILISKVLKAKAAAKAEPSNEEVKKFYAENAKTFSQPKMVKASHILIKVDPNASADVKAKKKKAIEVARARIQKGEDFAKVAKEVSEDPGSAAQGGSLGAFPQGQMVPEFDKVAFNSKTGELSPVFETSYGFHFLKVTEIKPPRNVPFEEARPQIIKFLEQRAQTTSAQTFVEKLVAGADVKYFLPEAPAEKESASEKAPQAGTKAGKK